METIEKSDISVIGPHQETPKCLSVTARANDKFAALNSQISATPSFGWRDRAVLS
jgi:hypothetical protein